MTTKQFAFWVFAWQPALSVLFLSLMPQSANVGVTALCTIAFLYGMFAPAVWWLLFGEDK